VDACLFFDGLLHLAIVDRPAICVSLADFLFHNPPQLHLVHQRWPSRPWPLLQRAGCSIPPVEPVADGVPSSSNPMATGKSIEVVSRAMCTVFKQNCMLSVGSQMPHLGDVGEDEMKNDVMMGHFSVRPK
jgi:hypothetical protein